MSWRDNLDKTQPCVPVIADKIFKGSQLRTTEKSTDEVLLWFDKYSGVDYIVKKDDNQLIGVASRVQWNLDYRTFTIRYSLNSGARTEYDKRIEAIDNDYIYPAITLQSYFKDDITPISAATIPTKNLFEFIKWNSDKWYFQWAYNAKFIVVRWRDLIEHGIVIYEGEKLKRKVYPDNPVQLNLPLF